MGLSRVGGNSVRGGYGQSARSGSDYGHGRSRYGRWARDVLSGYGTTGYGSGSDGYSYSTDGCSYVYGYGGNAYRDCPQN